MHFAANMGADTREYGRQIRATMAEHIAWINGEGEHVDDYDHDTTTNTALAGEELFFMEEQRPGEVCEARGRPTVAEIYSPPRVTALLLAQGLFFLESPWT